MQGRTTLLTGCVLARSTETEAPLNQPDQWTLQQTQSACKENENHYEVNEIHAPLKLCAEASCVS
jgi:hypothetical protein